jgi:hypothetical protein
MRYRTGVANFNRVFNMQTLLVQSQNQLAESEGEVARSLIAVYKAIGGGWQIRTGAASMRQIEVLPPVEESLPVEGSIPAGESLPAGETLPDAPASARESVLKVVAPAIP